MLCGRILGRHRFLQARSQSSERRSLIPRLFHADTGSTERYVHLADQHVPDAAGRIGGIVDGAMSDARKLGGGLRRVADREGRASASGPCRPLGPKAPNTPFGTARYRTSAFECVPGDETTSRILDEQEVLVEDVLLTISVNIRIFEIELT